MGRSVMADDIQFIDGKAFEDSDGGYVEFTGVRDGKEMKFRITREALDTFVAEPVKTHAFLDRFNDMKERILEVARRKSDAVGGGHSGVILIRWEDI